MQTKWAGSRTQSSSRMTVCTWRDGVAYPVPPDAMGASAWPQLGGRCTFM